MIDTLRQSQRGKWILAVAILVVYASFLFIFSPDVHRFDYQDYAVQEEDTLYSLLSREGREPEEVTNFITDRITEERARSYYDIPPEQIENEYIRTSTGTLISHPGDRLLANSSPSARDGDHITTEGNTLIISHPNGDYEQYQIASQNDLMMRRVQLGFFVSVLTIAMLLCLLWVWQIPSLHTSKVASFSATLNRIASEFRTVANNIFRLLVLAGIVLATLTAIAALLEWQLPGSFLTLTYPIYVLAGPVLLPFGVVGVLWAVTQITHVLVCGRFVRLTRAWGFLCFLGVYAIIFIGLLPWIV